MLNTTLIFFLKMERTMVMSNISKLEEKGVKQRKKLTLRSLIPHDLKY